MNKIIFGTYTVSQLLYAAGGILALLVVIIILIKVFSKKEPNIHIQFVKCPSCGWKGQVSRYAGRCPRCSQPLGDLLAKKINRSSS